MTRRRFSMLILGVLLVSTPLITGAAWSNSLVSLTGYGGANPPYVVADYLGSVWSTDEGAEFFRAFIVDDIQDTLWVGPRVELPKSEPLEPNIYIHQTPILTQSGTHHITFYGVTMLGNNPPGETVFSVSQTVVVP